MQSPSPELQYPLSPSQPRTLHNILFEDKWEGRCWIQNDKRPNRSRFPNTFTFMSYHMLADRKCAQMIHTSNKMWADRRQLLFHEIKNLNMDILCLQDVDHYIEWWQPQLMLLGYDSMFKQRTNDEESDHLEGVIVAYKRNLFQMFKSIPLELNHAADYEPANIRKQCKTDNVALICFLQPWPSQYLKSAICVCSAMLTEEKPFGAADVLQYQTKYICQNIEIANKEFQLPVVIGASASCEPSSSSYHIFRMGREPTLPRVPRKMKLPRVQQFSKGSVKLYWEPPVSLDDDLPILSYKIFWRPGGSVILGFSNFVSISNEACTQFYYITNDKGKRTSITMPERATIVPGLASEITYEFKICAVNALGDGELSDTTNPFLIIDNTPKFRDVVGVKPLQWLYNFEGVKAVREGEIMTWNDWDTNNALGTGVLDSLTQLSPRTLEGSLDVQISKARVLPISTNPREGWKSTLKGGTSAQLVKDLAQFTRIDRSVILDYAGYLPSVSSDRLSKRASYDINDRSNERRSSDASGNLEENSNSLIQDSFQEVDNVQFQNFEQLRAVTPTTETPIEFHNYDDDEWKEDDDNEHFSNANNSRPSSRNRPLSKGRPSSKTRPLSSNGPARIPIISANLEDDDEVNADFEGLEYGINAFSMEDSIEKRKLGKIGKFKGGSFQKGNSIHHLNRKSYQESFDEADLPIPCSIVEEGSLFSVMGEKVDNSGVTPGKPVVNAGRPSIIAKSAEQRSKESGSEVINFVSKLNASESFAFENKGVGAEGDLARTLEDDVLLDCEATMKNIGIPNIRNVHALNLRSAYEGYCSGGEPSYTESTPITTGGNGARCSDYIFYSQGNIVCSRMLSIPPLSQLKGDDPRQPVAVIDSNWKAPPPALNPYFNRHLNLGVDSGILIDAKFAPAHVSKSISHKIKSSLKSQLDASTDIQPLYGGMWAYFTSYNPERTHSWLPNDQYGSSHISLCAEFFLLDSNLAVEWI